MQKKGTLYVVSLPIGNLKDITLRALEILKNIKFIACEDTRSLKKILNYYQCGPKKLISLYKDVEKKKSERIIELLKKGTDIALVSEAGTPGISDPGAYLINLAYKNKIKIEPIPGPSALTCALSVSGIILDKGFIFLGFLPKKKEEQKKILCNLPDDLPIILFIPPHQMKKTLKTLSKILGKRKCFLARELTKLHEELLWTDLEELEKRENFLGEITLIILPEKTLDKEKEINLDIIKKEAQKLKSKGIGTKELTKILSKKFDLPVKEIYKYLLKIN